MRMLTVIFVFLYYTGGHSQSSKTSIYKRDNPIIISRYLDYLPGNDQLILVPFLGPDRNFSMLPQQNQ